uniref:Ribosomal RNA large subunit methyltransferase N n=2 Tax=Anthurium amnicola TaxID=1678845 RepID=A0A1D1YKJ8_9ARAE
MGSFDAKANYLKERPVCTEPLSQNPHLFGFNSGSQPTVSNTVSLQHSMSSAKDYSNIKVGASGKTMQQNSSCLVGSVDSAGRWPDHCPEVATSDLHEAISGNKSNLQSERFKKSGIGAHCPENASSCMEARGMSNRNDVESLGRRSRPHPSLGFIPTNQTRAGSDCFNPVVHAQVIDDPVEFMQLRSGQIPNKIITSNSLVINNQKQVMPTVSSPRSNSSAAAAAAARAWMSVGKSLEHKSIEASNLFRRQVGAAYLGNLTSEYLASTSRICEDDKKRPGASMSQTPSQPVADESCVQNKGLTAFPHFIMAELSRFHGQSSWRGLVPHVQLKQKKDMQPPDLNISFHSPGSPIRQSGILVDSQQPDLALQL